MHCVKQELEKKQLIFIILKTRDENPRSPDQEVRKLQPKRLVLFHTDRKPQKGVNDFELHLLVELQREIFFFIIIIFLTAFSLIWRKKSN